MSLFFPLVSHWSTQELPRDSTLTWDRLALSPRASRTWPHSCCSRHCDPFPPIPTEQPCLPSPGPTALILRDHWALTTWKRLSPLYLERIQPRFHKKGLRSGVEVRKGSKEAAGQRRALVCGQERWDSGRRLVPGPPVSVLGFLWSLAPDCSASSLCDWGWREQGSERSKRKGREDNKVSSSGTSSKAGVLTLKKAHSPPVCLGVCPLSPALSNCMPVIHYRNVPSPFYNEK